MLDDEEGCTIGDLVEVNAKDRVAVKRLLRDLQESRRVKKQKTPRIVSETFVSAVKLIGDAVVATSLGVGSGSQPHMDELTLELSNTREDDLS